jgi:hypothetical protein
LLSCANTPCTQDRHNRQTGTRSPRTFRSLSKQTPSWILQIFVDGPSPGLHRPSSHPSLLSLYSDVSVHHPAASRSSSTLSIHECRMPWERPDDSLLFAGRRPFPLLGDSTPPPSAQNRHRLCTRSDSDPTTSHGCFRTTQTLDCSTVPSRLHLPLGHTPRNQGHPTPGT